MSTLRDLYNQFQSIILNYNSGTLSDKQFIAAYEPLMQQLNDAMFQVLGDSADFTSGKGYDYWSTLSLNLTDIEIGKVLHGVFSDTSDAPIATNTTTSSTGAGTLANHFHADSWSKPTAQDFHVESVDSTPAPGTVPALPSAGAVFNTEEWHPNTSPQGTESRDANGNLVYTVAWGDTLWMLAQAYGTTIEAIAQANGISDPNVLYAGSSIVIPGHQQATSTTQAASIVPAQNPGVATTVSPASISTADDPYNISYFDPGDNPSWLNGQAMYTNVMQKFDLPGYLPARLRIVTPNILYGDNPHTGKTVDFEFIIGPQGLTESRANDIQQVKTGSGWVLYRTGPSLTQVSIQGYFMDTYDIDERRLFLSSYYDAYIVDQHRAFSDYFNDNRLFLEVEGIRYQGVLTSLSLSKSANMMFTYQYQMTFLSISQTVVGKLRQPTIPTTAVAVYNGGLSATQDPYLLGTGRLALGQGLYSILSLII